MFKHTPTQEYAQLDTSSQGSLLRKDTVGPSQRRHPAEVSPCRMAAFSGADEGAEAKTGLWVDLMEEEQWQEWGEEVVAPMAPKEIPPPWALTFAEALRLRQTQRLMQGQYQKTGKKP